MLGPTLEEIAQLRLEDIQCINSEWAFRICSLGPDQQLKSPGSFRMVPMHDEIIKCGFLAYAAEQKRAGKTHVFPAQLNENQHKNWSNAVGKWYSRHLDSIGLTDIRLCFHSHRFTFKQRLTLCSVQDEVRDALAGHWISANRQKSGRGYMAAPLKQYQFLALVQAIKKLRYDELDLSHLYVEEPLKGVEILLEANLECGAAGSSRKKSKGHAARLAALRG